MYLKLVRLGRKGAVECMRANATNYSVSPPLHALRS